MKKYKSFLISLLVIGAFLGSVGGGCGVVSIKTIKAIMGDELNQDSFSFKAFKLCTSGLPFVKDMDKLLQENNFIVLLQNSNEIRATGGFMGSYARIRTNPKGLEDISVQDIYVPDGQLPGHVEPPYPIQEAFGQGWWRLRDANWDADFASAAGATSWFFEQGGEKKIDGVAAINLNMIKKVLEVYGPIKLATYDEIVSAKNVDQLAQKYAEVGFTPGSTAKRDFLGTVGERLLSQIKQFDLIKDLKLANIIYKELKAGEIILWSRDEAWQKDFERRHWAGRLERSPNSDYLYIVESNLGANKANCCVVKEVRQELGKEIQISWKNDNPFEASRPPIFWGGNYINYVRVVVPNSSLNLRVSVNNEQLGKMEALDGPPSLRQGLSLDNYVIEKRVNFQIIGFWVVVEAGKSETAKIQYRSEEKYDNIKVRRQPGEKPWKYKLIIDGKIAGEKEIERDEIFGL